MIWREFGPGKPEHPPEVDDYEPEEICGWCGTVEGDTCDPNECHENDPIKPCADCGSEPVLYDAGDCWLARCSENDAGPSMTACPNYISRRGDGYEACIKEWNDAQTFARVEQR